MTKERAKALEPIILAYAEGKKLQYKCDSEWVDMISEDTIDWCLTNNREMRIKPEVKYRPFKSCNELVYYFEREKIGYSANPLQMIDIWVKHKVDGRRRMIVGFGDNFVEVGVKAKPITLERLFEMYTFLDESPCGVCE